MSNIHRFNIQKQARFFNPFIQEPPAREIDYWDALKMSWNPAESTTLSDLALLDDSIYQLRNEPQRIGEIISLVRNSLPALVEREGRLWTEAKTKAAELRNQRENVLSSLFGALAAYDILSHLGHSEQQFYQDFRDYMMHRRCPTPRNNTYEGKCLLTDEKDFMLTIDGYDTGPWPIYSNDVSRVQNTANYLDGGDNGIIYALNRDLVVKGGRNEPVKMLQELQENGYPVIRAYKTDHEKGYETVLERLVEKTWSVTEEMIKKIGSMARDNPHMRFGDVGGWMKRRDGTPVVYDFGERCYNYWPAPRQSDKHEQLLEKGFDTIESLNFGLVPPKNPDNYRFFWDPAPDYRGPNSVILYKVKIDESTFGLAHPDLGVIKEAGTWSTDKGFQARMRELFKYIRSVQGRGYPNYETSAPLRSIVLGQPESSLK